LNFKDKNVLITGISGFVGSYLARSLLDKGAQIYGMVRRRSDSTIPKNLREKSIDKSIIYIESGLEDLTGLTKVIEVSEPDYIFHLAAQSFVPRSFSNPLETAQINGIGTNNLLEAVRMKEADPVLVFAGTSEEYGLVISSGRQLKNLQEKYGTIYPEPDKIPELPITENNPLRPMSPYAVSKVYGDFLVRNYFYTYGMKGMVSRAFNHEGAGRGIQFVTSVITNQVCQFLNGERDHISIGNVNAFRDWSHINDIIDGYQNIAMKGRPGEVYNQGSHRTTSVLSYLLYSLEASGYEITSLSTIKSDKCVKDPLNENKLQMFGNRFEKSDLDHMMLEGEIEFGLDDGGLLVKTTGQDIPVRFDPERFRPSDVPILFSDISKISSIGYQVRYKIRDIVKDQLEFYSNPENRSCIHTGQGSE
jgi:GDPmannose 4,6-dehydratase